MVCLLLFFFLQVEPSVSFTADFFHLFLCFFTNYKQFFFFCFVLCQVNRFIKCVIICSILYMYIFKYWCFIGVLYFQQADQLTEEQIAGECIPSPCLVCCIFSSTLIHFQI